MKEKTSQMQKKSAARLSITAKIPPNQSVISFSHFITHYRAAILDFTVAALAVLALFVALNAHGYDPTFIWQACNLFLLVMLIMLKLFCSYRVLLPLPTNLAILGFAVFLGWVALSMLWSPIPGDSFMVTLTISTGFWAMLLGFWANNRQWAFFRLLLVPLALLIIALTAYQAFILKIERPAGLLLNWNTNSAFLGAILIPYCADYLRRVSQERNTLLLGLFLACCAFGMSLGQGRGSLFTLGIGLLSMFFVYRRQAHAYRGMMFTLLLVVTGYALADALHGGLLAQRLSTTGTGDVHALGSGREYLWTAGWRMYLDRPWLGWGVGVFHWLYPRYRSPLNVEGGQYVHNDYFQFLIELGPMGLLLSLCWVAALIWLVWRLFRSTHETGPRYTDFSLALACAAILLHTFVDFHLYQSSMLILLGAYIGRLSNRYSQQTDSGKRTVSPQLKFTSTGYFSILTAITLFLSVGLTSVVIGFLAVREASLEKRPFVAFEQMEKAQRFLPFIEDFQTWQGMVIVNLIRNEPNKLPLVERDQLINYALQRSDQTIKNNPISALNHKFKAELLLLLPGKPAEIIEHLQKSLDLDPYQIDVRLELANSLEKNGAALQAQQVLADGMNRRYFSSPQQARVLLGKIDDLIGKSVNSAAQKQVIQQQIKALESMKLASPNDRLEFTLPDIGWKP